VGRLRGALARTLGHDAVERERAWGEVSELLKPVTVRRVFSASGVRLEPAEGAPVLAGIAAAVQALVDADSWPRLRVCPNHLCNRAFYDSTRSRTQRWDSFDTCGNKANVAAHRARVRERAGK
jgi:predicted RNA-binding Zn ribbon-like protein